MLDQHDGRSEFVIHIKDKAAHVLFLLDVHAGHRLVQQKDRRLGRQGAGQLHPFLQAIGQAAHRRLADRLDFKEVDDLLHDLPVLDLFPLGLALPDRLRQQARFHLPDAARHDVVEHGHPLEQGNVLESPRDTLLRHLVGLHLRALLALVEHLALLRVVEAADHVQHARLARAVRPDDRPDLALADVEADILDRHHAAKAQRDVLHLHHHPADLAAVLGDKSLGRVKHVDIPR